MRIKVRPNESINNEEVHSEFMISSVLNRRSMWLINSNQLKIFHNCCILMHSIQWNYIEFLQHYSPIKATVRQSQLIRKTKGMKNKIHSQNTQRNEISCRLYNPQSSLFSRNLFKNFFFSSSSSPLSIKVQYNAQYDDV